MYLFLNTAISPPSDYTRELMNQCFKQDGKNQCYRKVSGELLQKYGPGQILEIFQDSEQYPEVFSRCHEVTHYIGRAAFKQEGSVAQAYGFARDVCHGGFYHGVIEGYFQEKDINFQTVSEDTLATEVRTVCGEESDFSAPRIYVECVHGIGHALMFITNSELPQALRSCDSFAPLREKEICYGGVFMENSSSSTNFDHPPKYLKSADPLYPCNILDAPYRQVCYKYQSSYFAEVSHWDWRKTIVLCFTVPESFQEGCFAVLGSNQVGYYQDLADMAGTCSLIRESHPLYSTRYEACVRGVIDGLTGRYVGDADRSIRFCQLADFTVRAACFEQLGKNIQGWTRDRKHLENICREIGEEAQSQICLRMLHQG